MSDYRSERENVRRHSLAIGAVMTILLHCGVFAYAYFAGLTYLSPPPPEQQNILIEFENEVEVEQVERMWNGTQPRVEEPDRTRRIELVQRSEAQETGTKANLAQETVVDDFGDVEKYQPETERTIEQRALFRAANNKTDKDTLAPQTANEPSDKLKAGHASGNTKSGKTDGEPNAHLKGRSLDGTLPKPAYNVQVSGTVVVAIWVDQYGSVVKAQAGAEGTTVTDATLWAAARKAALGAHFNQAANAPALQEGTITYVFKLK